MENNEIQIAMTENALLLTQEKIKMLEKQLREHRAVARSLKRLLEAWNQPETDSQQSSTT